MTVRWVRDGLKLVRVRVDAPAPAKPRPLPLKPRAVEDFRREEASLPEHEVAEHLHGFAARLRHDAWRARRVNQLQASRKPRRPPEERSRVDGADVKKARTLTGLTQRELAAELGIARGTIANAENHAGYVPASLGAWAAGVLRAEGERP